MTARPPRGERFVVQPHDSGRTWQELADAS